MTKAKCISHRGVFLLFLVALALPLVFYSQKQSAASTVVTITEFSDFQCPYCKRAASVLEQVRHAYGESVKVVFKQMPLSMHRQAFKAAQASVCAEQQGKFWEFHDRLFAATDLSMEALQRMGSEVGLNQNTLHQCLTSAESWTRVQSDVAEAERLGVTGTPTFFVNGRPIKGAATFETLTREIDNALLGLGKSARSRRKNSLAPTLTTLQVEPLPKLNNFADSIVANDRPVRRTSPSRTTGGLTFSPGTLDFGYGLVGTSTTPVTETVINSSNSPFVINGISVSGRDRTDFTASYDFKLPVTIAPWQSIEIRVTFSPHLPWKAGSRDANLQLTPQKGTFQPVPLTGVGATCEGPLPACSSACADIDGDGLNDAAEILGGIDVNNDGKIDTANDVVLGGAEANRPDVYIWYDWMDYGPNDQTCATNNDCAGLGSYHADETCNSQGQCVYSCSTDFDCTSRSPANAHQGERCISNTCQHTHDPLVFEPNTFKYVVDRFAAHGINLHVLRGTAQPHSHVVSLRSDAQMTVGCEGASAFAGTVGVGKYAVSFYELKQRSNPDKLNLAYHYAMFGHYVGCDSSAHCPANAGNSSNCTDRNLTFGQSGLAEISGNDLVVSLGAVVNDSGVSSRLQLPLTFMHELGHNLGLRHEGHLDRSCSDAADCSVDESCSDTFDGQGKVCHANTIESNYKPNYLSIMNYMYQRNGILLADNVGSRNPMRCNSDSDCATYGAVCSGRTGGVCVRVDYSDQTLPTGGATPGALVENDLDDTVGLGSGRRELFWYMDGTCHTCAHLSPTTGPVDWLGLNLVTNGHCEPIGDWIYTFTDTHVTADIDQIDYSMCDLNASETLHGANDWPDLSGNPFHYVFQCSAQGLR